MSIAELDAPVETNGQHLPFSLSLELVVKDAETIAELCRHNEGVPRDQFALDALRIGVLALRQARGQLDVDLLQRETQRMLERLAAQLGEHSRTVQQNVAGSLKEYFDPQDGRFSDRVRRLIGKDGELEALLRSQIGSQDSELCKTLLNHFGESSKLMKLLSPSESQGLLAALRETVATQLSNQRETVLKEFSLDNKAGALARLVEELRDDHGELNKSLQTKIDVVVKQFSLDEEDSALSRLVKNVNKAQETISSQFSLDNEQSAFSRLQRLLNTTNDAIHSNLTLDDESSSLAKLKRELLDILKQHSKDNTEFREEVKLTLNSIIVRRQEAARSTRHGDTFEEAVGCYLTDLCIAASDTCNSTGKSVGAITNCKIGDFVIELGPESAAPGAKIVVEAKEEEKYTIEKARQEIETARKNRNAQVGIFVFSKHSTPRGINGIERIGEDILVSWDSDDTETDLFLKMALSLAKWLSIRSALNTAENAVDLEAINASILSIEKQAKSLNQILVSSRTIFNAAKKIRKRANLAQKGLNRQINSLRKNFADVRKLVTQDSSSE